MDASSKLAAAVVAAAAMVVVGYASFIKHARSTDVDQAQPDLASLHQARQNTEPASGSQARQPDPLIAADVAELKTQYRHLAPNERCVDGVVIVVNGSTYTQPGPVGKSVRCSGGYAER